MIIICLFLCVARWHYHYLFICACVYIFVCLHIPKHIRNKRVTEKERERGREMGGGKSTIWHRWKLVAHKKSLGGIFVALFQLNWYIRQPWQPQKRYTKIQMKWCTLFWTCEFFFNSQVFFLVCVRCFFAYNLDFSHIYFHTNRWAGIDLPAVCFTTYK